MDYANLTERFEFKNDEVARVFDELRIFYASIVDARSDLDSDKITILNTDYANGYPFITPREHDLSSKNNHDMICRKLFELSGTYSSRITRYVITYNPFFLFELFDQLDHRRAYARRVLDTKNDDDMHKAVLSAVREMPTDKESVKALIGKQVEQTQDGALTNRLNSYRDKIDSGAIANIFNYVDRERYFSRIENDEDFTIFMSDIDRFRRPSTSSDPHDAEMHKQIDVMMLLSTLSAQENGESVKLRYWGQDRLRRIFDSKMHELSRDALSPYLILQGLMEVSHDRILDSDLRYNLARRESEVKSVIEDLYKMRSVSTIPITLAKACLRSKNDINKIINGRTSVADVREYDDIMKTITKKARIKDVFEQAELDAANAEMILKQLAQVSIDPDARKILTLRPNRRITALLDKLNR